MRRKRISARLGREGDARVTLVSGPAGSGKSVGVAQWARTLPLDVAWLTLDARDSDPQRFRRRVLEAARCHDATYTTDAWLDRVVTLPNQTVLVCDGIDLVTDPETVADLDELCVRAPEQLHVVLVGRALPVLPSLARMRLTGDIHELGAEDLRCRPEEAADVLHALGVAASREDREQLLDRTEGLIGAVALAGVLGRGHDAAQVLKDFGGDTPELAQYLYTEVVGDLTVDVFGFLLATCVFEVLDPAGCDELTGRTDSNSVLADLARRHVLTEAVDNGTSYRYHRLLSDFLRGELKRAQPERWKALHRAAAASYERQGDEDRALHHWVEAGEIEEAWSRFQRRALPRFFDGAVTSVAAWAELLPKPNDVSDISRALDMTLTLIYMGDVASAEDWRQLVDSEFEIADTDTESIGRRAYLEFLLDFAHGNLLRAARQATRARQLLAGTSTSWDEFRAPCAHAQLQSLLGRPARAAVTIAEYIARFNPRHATDDVAIPTVLCEIALAEGRHTDAIALADQALLAAEHVSDTDFWFTIEPHYVRGVVLLERNNFEDARAELERACALAAKQGFVHAKVLPLIAMARAQHVSGDKETARQTLSEARRYVPRADSIPIMQRIDEADALLALADGDFETVFALLARLHEPCRSHVRARLHASLGEHDLAELALEHVPITSLRDRVETLLLRARGVDEDAALPFVRKALERAESEHYVRVFAAEGDWLAPIIRRLVGEWPSGYAAEIAAAIVAEPDRHLTAQNLSDLSEREQEVWRFLSTSLSMREIAEALYVSRNTLKSHVRSIYRKLGVSTREGAVGRTPSPRRAEA